MSCGCADPSLCDIPMPNDPSPDDGDDDNGDGDIDDPGEQPPDLDGGTGDGGGGGPTDAGPDPDAGYNNNGPPPDPDTCEGSGPNSVAYAQGNAFIRPVTDFKVALWGEEYFEFQRGYDSNSGWFSSVPGNLVIETGKRAIFTRADGRKVFFRPLTSAWRDWLANDEFATNYRMYRTDAAYTGCPWSENVEMDFEVTDERYVYRYHLAAEPSPPPGGGNCSRDTLHALLTEIVDQKTGNTVLEYAWTIPGGGTKLTFAPGFAGTEGGGAAKVVCAITDGDEQTIYGPFDAASEAGACNSPATRQEKPIVKYVVPGGGDLLRTESGVRIESIVHFNAQGGEYFRESFQYKYGGQGGKFLTAHFRGSDPNVLMEAFDYYPPDDKPSQRNKVMWQISDKDSVVFTYNDENTEATVCQMGNPTACKKITYRYNRLVTGKTGSGSCGSCGRNEMVSANWSGFQPRWRGYRNKRAVSQEFADAAQWVWHPPSEIRQHDQNEPAKVLKTRYWYDTVVTSSGAALEVSAPLTVAESVVDEALGDKVLKTTIYDYTEAGTCLGMDTASLRARESPEPIGLPAPGGTLPACGPASPRLKRIIVEGYDPLDQKYVPFSVMLPVRIG